MACRARTAGQRYARCPLRQFVADFNRNWHAIRGAYPIYGALESIYRTASAAELMHRYADSDRQRDCSIIDQ